MRPPPLLTSGLENIRREGRGAVAQLLIPLRALEAPAAVPAGGTDPSGGPSVTPPSSASGPLAANGSAAPTTLDDPVADALARWVAVASASPDACIVVDHSGRVAAVSANAAALLGEAPAAMVGRGLVDGVLELVDFSDEAGPGDRRIPPLLALTSDVLTRGLLRIRRSDGRRLTIDAVAAPLHAGGGRVVGALAFLAVV